MGSMTVPLFPGRAGDFPVRREDTGNFRPMGDLSAREGTGTSASSRPSRANSLESRTGNSGDRLGNAPGPDATGFAQRHGGRSKAVRLLACVGMVELGLCASLADNSSTVNRPD